MTGEVRKLSPTEDGSSLSNLYYLSIYIYYSPFLHIEVSKAKLFYYIIHSFYSAFLIVITCYFVNVTIFKLIV